MNVDDYKLSVVFCAVDETDLLQDAFLKINSEKAAFEYLFVLAKSCTKECLDTVKNICETNETCRYMIQSDYGLGNAVRDAFAAVNGTHVIFWPADDGMDSDAFPKMVRLSKENPEKIITVSRWLQKDGFENYGTIRKFINYLSQKMFAVLYKSNLTDFTNPTQIAPVSVYRQIKWQGTGFDLMPEMTFKPLKLGYEFIEVPCKNLKKRSGHNHSTFFGLVKYYYVIYKIYRMKKTDISVGVEK